MDDWRLLRQYVDEGSETAFADLVSRHINVVYSAAFRRLGDSHAAEEICQVVFSLLAVKAAGLTRHTALVSWLYQTASFKASRYWRGEARRRHREQEAAMINTTATEADDADAVWQQLAPSLEDAINALGEQDRVAILQRFFEQKPLREIGHALGIGEDAARMRINRALERMRLFLVRRGAVCSLALLSTLLAERAVHAAPAALAPSVSTAALAAKASVGPSLLALFLALLAKSKPQAVWILAVLTAASVALLFQTKRDAAAPPDARTNLSASIPPALLPAPELREPFPPGALLTFDSPPGAVVVQPDGKILAAATLGGWFMDELSGTLGWYSRGAMRFEADGSLDRTFYCNVGRPGSTAAMMAHLDLSTNGRVFMSGLFGEVDGNHRPGYAMLLPDGRVDDSFVPWRGATNVPGRTFLPGGTFPGALLSDGSVAIMSPAVEGPRAPHPLTVYRLNPSGQLIDPTNTVLAEFSRPAGLVMSLTQIGFWARHAVDWTRQAAATRRTFHFPPGTTRPPVTDLPFEQWIEPPSATQAAIVLQDLFAEVPLELCRYAVRLPDGGAILAIRDEIMGGEMKARGRFMRFDKKWLPDFSFANSFESDLRSWMTLKRLSDGRFLLAGLIGTINGEKFPGLVRLDPNGVIDRTFRCKTADDLSGRIMDFAVQQDGRIIVCGYFEQINGIDAPRIARLYPDGSVDSTFKTPFVSLQELKRRRTLRVARLTKPLKAPQVAVPGSAGTNTPAASTSSAAPETIQITGISMADGLAVISFKGTPRQLYVLQGSETMPSTNWTSITTNQANASGAGVLRDNESKNHPMRLYRIATP
jgi:RNA polymerase sigma factor (sigma-70 family)